jgi:fermentation-respiration switch protein FrsA (DUF1100 family)
MLIFVEIIVVLLIAYSALGWTLYLMQPTFVYKPAREVSYTPEELGLDYDNVTLKTADGVQLSSWFVPAEDSGPTVLFCHGNGGNIMHRLDTINILHNLRLNCFIFDYRGYGDSEGKPSEEGTYLDATAAYNWLTKVRNIPATRIIILGRSLGASIAAQLASKVKARGLIIESGFTSYVDMGRKFYPYMPVRWFASFSYRTVDYIRQVNCPTLIIHSRNDEIVPFEFGLELYEAANEPKRFVELFGSHNDSFLVSSDIYNRAWTKWLKFLEQHYRGRSAGQQVS